MDTKYSGIYVECDSNNLNSYAKWLPGSCIIDGELVTGCWVQTAAENIAWCYEPDEWLATDTGVGGETGEAPDGEGIYRSDWPTHTPSTDYIGEKCTAQCIGKHAINSGESYTCDKANWVIKGAEPPTYIKVLATQLTDPAERTCNPWYSKNEVGKSPTITTVIPAGQTPQWPTDRTFVSLSCSNFLSCSAEFDEEVMRHLNHMIGTPPGANEVEADYLATSSVASLSSLSLTIHNAPGPSTDSNWVGGRFEYSAPDCGLAACPIYLGNLTLTNSSDIWSIYSDALLDNVDVENIEIQLRRPVLGVWRTGSDEVYFGDQMLDLRVTFDISIGLGTSTSVTKYVTNSGPIFGDIGGGAVQLDNIAVTDGNLEASADVDYNSLDGSPPVASMSLPGHIILSGTQTGVLVSSISTSSSDPDSDLSYTTWMVDGQQVAPSYEIPTGTHTVRLEVRDSRFAYDYQEASVLISY